MSEYRGGNNRNVRRTPASATRSNASANTRVNNNARRSQAIITFLVVLAVFIYLLGQFMNLLNRDSTNYIVAQNGEIVDSFSAQGVIVRDEMLVRASTSGIVEYYYPAGKELKAGTLVCALHDNAYGEILQSKIDEIYEQIADMDDAAQYNEAFESLDTNIAQSVSQYLRAKSTTNYASLYLLRSDLMDAVGERKDMYSLVNNTRVSSLLAEQKIYLDEQSSIISNLYLSSGGLLDFSYDGYEGWTTDQINSDFLQNYDGYYSYFQINMQTVKAGDPLYRLVYSPQWSVVLYLTEEEASFFNGMDTVSFIYNSSDKLTGRVATLDQTGYDEYKLVLKLTERVQDFMHDRIATIVFNKNSHTGIKISDSCLVSREYFVIPKKYLMQSGDDYGYVVVGNNGSYFQKITIVSTDDDWIYYSLPEGAPTTVTIQMQSTLDTMLTGATGSLYGVYVVNGANEQFESVTVLYQAQGYSIVEGINLYDRIKINKD